MMKKIGLLLLAVFAVTQLAGQAEPLPAGIDQPFRTKFAKAKNIQWYMENSCCVIEFDQGPETYTVKYTPEGTWIETARIIADTDVPAVAMKEVKFVYKDLQVAYSESVENAQAEKFYRIHAYNDNSEYVIDVTGAGKITKAENRIFVTGPGEA